MSKFLCNFKYFISSVICNCFRNLIMNEKTSCCEIKTFLIRINFFFKLHKLRLSEIRCKPLKFNCRRKMLVSPIVQTLMSYYDPYYAYRKWLLTCCLQFVDFCLLWHLQSLQTQDVVYYLFHITQTITLIGIRHQRQHIFRFA